MRIILFLLSLLISVQGLSQGTRPSNSQIQAQMKEAIADAKKQRDELQQQLTTAKANKEDPASIKQMESQLSILDKMISQLGAVNLSGNQPPKSLPATTATEPDYVSPFTPITLKSPVATPTIAQAKDELLWFRGRKIDPNTLITTAGTVVRYTSDNNELTIQPEKKDSLYYGMVTMLSLLKKDRSDYITELDQDPNSFFMFPEIDAARDQFEYYKGTFYDMAKNTEVLTKPAQAYNEYEAAMGQLKNFMGSLSPKPNYPEFPGRQNTLCTCDPKAAEKKFYDEIIDWNGKYYRDESRLWELMSWVYQDRDNIIRSGGPRPDPAELQQVTSEAKVLIIKRLTWKLYQITDKYRQKEIDFETPMVCAVMILDQALERAVDITPAYQNAENDARFRIEIAKGLINGHTFLDYMNDQKASKNFDRVFNKSLYVMHEKNRNMLGFKKDDKQWEKFIKDFNRFSLVIKANFEYQNTQKKESNEDEILMIATGTMESDKMTVSLGIEDCNIRVYLTDVNHKNLNTDGEEFKIPMNVKSGTKDYTKDNLPVFNYMGPATMRLLFPTFKLNLCGQKSEVKMDFLSYLPSDLKAHEHDNYAKMYTTDMFTYANKMFLAVQKTQVDADAVVQSAIDGLNMITSATNGSGNSKPITDDRAFEQMRRIYEMNKKRYELQKRIGEATEGDKAVVTLGVIDPRSSSILYNMPVELADSNDPDRAKGIVLRHGILTIELIHTPK